MHLLILKPKKKHKEKKNHKEEKNADKGRRFPLNSCFALSLLAPAFALLLLPYCFKRFLLASFYSQVEEKKKKTIEKKKNAEKGGSLPSRSRSTTSLLAPTSGLMFLPLRFKRFLLGIFFFLSRRKKRKTQRKKNHKEEKNVEKGRSLPFFSHFCIWDEVLLLLSPLHIPSTLSSPPSSSLVFHVSSKLCATQAWELSQALEWNEREMR